MAGRRRWLSARSLNMAFLFAANLFLIVVVVLFVVTAVAWMSVRAGLLKSDFWTNPLLLTVLAFVVSAIIAAIVLVMANNVVLRPLRSMVDALKELASGNFDVAMERKDGVSVDEVDDFVDAFNATARELKSVEVLRHDFVDDFSHEFKTPISSINGFANLLLEEDVADDERREYAGIIAAESKRLASMAGDVLALRQAESLERLPHERQVDAGEQVRRAVVLVGEKWTDKQLDLACEIEDACCTGSPALLERVWANLLDNACKFSPAGGRVWVTLRKSEVRRIEFRVENGGPAIGPAALDRIFERFYQDDPSHAVQGCGLGLPLVKRVVELHGGTVFATSTPQGRTAFVVVLADRTDKPA
ncbi:HAMP domain-containing sensor histidine kinase [Gordonibacter massiliensis (ex Traore et al. 2017)]|uniref:Sensor-like histidine kinase SenX3 n=1 Tax=Gordonibacter massiliensis (ex Traore et al. 2017) TaxID=1841863 RepID=A0A842JD30_9ACTN|nr:HAMP domain-containing sensor histidine kinase [Gordonibacter massiliensis (ex Traore et al. 2017)]MBC2890162.1 HAMP domain-containing histidine kinase [Gordonibacter massiliensis (ex Traore et al. 2017)]